MRSLPLRRLVAAIGLLVALTTALSIPIGYAMTSYLAEAERLAFQSRLNASRVARYIYQYGALWSFQRTRLAELIELSSEQQDALRQRVTTAAGRPVIEEGALLPVPVITRETPIVVSGAVVGKVEVQTSARPLLLQTALVALISSLLGLLAYLGVYVIPLRVLDRTMGRLAEREQDLTDTNGKFSAALDNMPHGLCFFDDERRLVLCNARYAQLYDLPPHLQQPGTPVQDILDYRARTGTAPHDFRSYLTEVTVHVQPAETRIAEHALEDGRTIRISHKAMENGGFVASHEDVTDTIRDKARIAHMAHHDSLTNLPNRTLFRERLEQALARMDGAEKIAVLCLDLDHFKAVNDTLGHPIGDALLHRVADRLRDLVREADTIARLGGDEFAIVTVGADATQRAPVLAERIIECLANPYDLEGHQVVIGASVGVAFAPDDATDADQLLKSADMALYRAKSDGRSTYRFFEPEMDARMQARRSLELDLRKALPNGEFVVHYQPLVDLDENRVSGFEALLRWTHPERGSISPADFIPLAEEIGLINQIGAWVLKEACAAAADWPDDVRIAVNLSPAQFKSRTLVLDVIAALGASGLSPSRLELEITETVMLEDTEATLALLHELRGLGVRISMDDFGTGYSSLSYLRKFPFDKIKIDQSFIRDLPGGGDAVAIVRAVTGLGQSLGMTTTAEGVETFGQLEKLKAEGCNEVQGWLFSAARPAHEIAELMQQIAERFRKAA